MAASGWLHTDMAYHPQMVTHPSINRARRRATTLIETNMLPLSQATTCVEAGNDCDCDVSLGDLESLANSARFLLLLSQLYQQQNRYEDRIVFLKKAKEVQDRYGNVMTVIGLIRRYQNNSQVYLDFV